MTAGTEPANGPRPREGNSTRPIGPNVVLISTYELGRQPFGIASPAAWLAAQGAHVTCADLAVGPLPEADVRTADLIAFYVPMHTATRLAVSMVPRIRDLNPTAQLCFYGLYAPMNEALLRGLGAVIIGGEFEEGLVRLARSIAESPPPDGRGLPLISLARQQFIRPDRSGLPSLRCYARMVIGDEERIVGYTEATRGCKHRCRHCPIVPVYDGRFRVVHPDVVIEDIAQQVAAGAQHITFGDPDFFNGPRHALAVMHLLHGSFPEITYDVTIKIEHLIKHAHHLQTLRETGCVLVTSAVESVDERELVYLDKGHTAQDFVQATYLLHRTGLGFNPTFVTFTPWTTMASFQRLLETIVDLQLIANVSPVQYAIRLLIPAGSRLLELPEVAALIQPFEQESLSYPWENPDLAVDDLYDHVRTTVLECQARDASRPETFEAIWRLAATDLPVQQSDSVLARARAVPSQAVPRLTEAWYCCAEPTDEQLSRVL